MVAEVVAVFSLWRSRRRNALTARVCLGIFWIGLAVGRRLRCRMMTVGGSVRRRTMSCLCSAEGAV